MYLLRPESRRIIELPDQKIAVNDVFSLDQRKYILIFKSAVDLDLRILYLDKRLFLNRLCFLIVTDIKLKISRPHPSRNRLHHAIFAQKIIQNPRDAHNVDRAGFRADVVKIDRLKVIGYLRARHPLDIGRNLRKILI